LSQVFKAINLTNNGLPVNGKQTDNSSLLTAHGQVYRLLLLNK